MLPRRNRISREQFSKLRTLPYKKHTSSEGLSAHWYPTGSPQGFRVGIIISSKSIPSSVSRHQIKRRLYSFFAEKVYPQGALVLYPSKKTAGLRGERLREVVEGILEALRVERI